MRRNVLIVGAVAAGAAGLIYAAAQGGQSQPPAGHEGHSHVQTAPDQAAHENAGMGHDMMCQHMGRGMAGMVEMEAPLAALDRPLVRSLFGAFLIPDLQSELNLTADQSSQLKQQKADLLAKGEDFSRKIAAKSKELDALFSPDTSKGQQVKLLLEQIAELRAQQHYTIYTAARKMKGVLTDDQRNRLESWNAEQIRHAAMSHLTLEDLAKATQLLRTAL